MVHVNKKRAVYQVITGIQVVWVFFFQSNGTMNAFEMFPFLLISGLLQAEN